MQDFFVYILKCNDGSYYIGHTESIERRLADHSNGTYEGYTASRLPVRLVFLEVFHTRDEAFIMERRLKGWSRAKKQALIDKNWDQLQLLSKKQFEK